MLKDLHVNGFGRHSKKQEHNNKGKNAAHNRAMAAQQRLASTFNPRDKVLVPPSYNVVYEVDRVVDRRVVLKNGKNYNPKVLIHYR